ncbi:MAG: hypothetical protein RI907_501 [Pseudomonadota bacterium]|jgi:hypothetical protein
MPVLYVAGILGSKLYDRQTQLHTWGDARGLLMRGADEAGFAPDARQPGRVLLNEALHEFSIVPGLLSSIVTRDVVNALEVGLGYRLNVDLFFMAYDWRADYRRLGERLENEVQRLQQQFGEDQPVLLIGQSVANLGLRYWLRHADARWRQAIGKWYAFGPPWQGTWNAVHMLQDGYWPGTRAFHGFAPEDVAQCPSTWQLLPAESRLADHDGSDIVGFDIYDAHHWREHGLPADVAQLQARLDDGRAFAQAVSGWHPADDAVPQTWFVNDSNLAVSRAVRGGPGQPALTTLDALRRQRPQLVPDLCEPGDDHIPLRHITQAPCGPLVSSHAAMPWGHNAVLIGQAADHRAQINHGPNLLALVRDIAALQMRHAGAAP